MERLNIDPQVMGSKVVSTSARVKAAKKSAKAIKEDSLPVRLIFILDRSSSMETMRDEAIAGFNKFLSDQQEVPGKAVFSLVLFDQDVFLVNDSTDIRKMPPLNRETYVPNGMTALYDAIGYVIARYKHSPAAKTIVAVLTDGAENSSRRYDAQEVKSMIKDMETEGGWEVLFLGANIDVKQYAAAMGTKLNNSFGYDYTKKGIADGIATASLGASMFRGRSLNVGGQTMNASNMSLEAVYKSLKSGDAVTEAAPVASTDDKTS